MLKKLFGNVKKEKHKGVEENKANEDRLQKHELPGAQEVIDMIIDPKVADIFGMRNMANWKYEMVPVGNKEELWPCMKQLREAEMVASIVLKMMEEEMRLMDAYRFQRDNNEWMRDKIRKYKETGCDTYFNHELAKKYIPLAKEKVDYDEIDDWMISDKKWFDDDVEARDRASYVASGMADKLSFLFYGIHMNEFNFKEALKTEAPKFKE